MTERKFEQEIFKVSRDLHDEEIRSLCLYLFMRQKRSERNQVLGTEAFNILMDYALDYGIDKIQPIADKLALDERFVEHEYRVFKSTYEHSLKNLEKNQSKPTKKITEITENDITACLSILFINGDFGDQENLLQVQNFMSNVLHVYAVHKGYKNIEMIADKIIKKIPDQQKDIFNQSLLKEWIKHSKSTQEQSAIDPCFSNYSSRKKLDQADHFIDERTYRLYRLNLLTELHKYSLAFDGNVNSDAVFNIIKPLNEKYRPLNTQQKVALYTDLLGYCATNNISSDVCNYFANSIGLLDRRDVKDFDTLVREFKRTITSFLSEKANLDVQEITDTHLGKAIIESYYKILGSYLSHGENMVVFARAARELSDHKVIQESDADRFIHLSLELAYIQSANTVERSYEAWVNDRLKVAELTKIDVQLIHQLRSSGRLDESIIKHAPHPLLDKKYQYIHTQLYTTVCHTPNFYDVSINSFFNHYLHVIDTLVKCLDIENQDQKEKLRNNIFAEVLFNKDCYPTRFEQGLIYRLASGDEQIGPHLFKAGLSNINLDINQPPSKYIESFKEHVKKAGIENDFRITNFLDVTPLPPLKVKGQQPKEGENVSSYANEIKDGDITARGTQRKIAPAGTGLKRKQMAVHLYPEDIELTNQAWEKAGFSNRTDYVESVIRNANKKILEHKPK